MGKSSTSLPEDSPKVGSPRGKSTQRLPDAAGKSPARGAGTADEKADKEEDMMTWDMRVVVVRQGQLQIELQHREPPLSDKGLLQFCKWVEKQLPSVLRNFPYIKKSGCSVD